MLGGRNPEKLEELRRGSAPSAGTMRADLADEATLRAFAEDCAVALNLAGPYADYGERVMRACVDAAFLDLRHPVHAGDYLLADSACLRLYTPCLAGSRPGSLASVPGRPIGRAAISHSTNSCTSTKIMAPS